MHQCITPEAAGMTESWFAPMLIDKAYLYAICFTTQAYFDGFFGRTRSAEAQRRDRVYYSMTVRMLQERLALNDDSVKLSDSTVMTVLALSGHAYTTGDYQSANNHMSGLLKLVSMRDVRTFLQNTKLAIEIIRLVLVYIVNYKS
jgi:Fungal specific transcription factor domain